MSQKQHGSTAVGILMGLILGLVVAVLVAVFVTKAPVPFVNKAPGAGTRVEPKLDAKADPKAVPTPASPVVAEGTDPNRSMNAKNAKPSDNGTPMGDKGTETASPTESKDSIFGLLGQLGKDNPKTAPAGTEPTKEPSKTAPKEVANKEVATKEAPPPKEPKPKSNDDTAVDTTRYLLQAGAFRERDDADGMKGRLALLGIEARISTVDREGTQIFRVRAGPYKQLDDANAARRRMAEGGVETSLVPIR
jgi:cell division protein FtsN